MWASLETGAKVVESIFKRGFGDLCNVLSGHPAEHWTTVFNSSPAKTDHDFQYGGYRGNVACPRMDPSALKCKLNWIVFQNGIQN